MRRHLLHLHRRFINKRHSARIGRRLFAVCFLLFAVFFSATAFAHDPFGVDLKVWSSQSFDDPFCSDDPIDIYFRVDRLSYITVYQINPYGGVEILYPLAYHRWAPVFPGRTYRLTDLAADLDFFYGGIEGRAYIGIIATRQPIDIVPWLQAGFRDCGLVFGRPGRVAVGIDFQVAINRVLADVRVRLGGACVPTFYVTPIYVRPHVILHRPPLVWPAPHRHKAYPPQWHGHDNYPSSPRRDEKPEKRPIRRRDFKTPQPHAAPYSPIPVAPQRPQHGKSYEPASKKAETVKVKNDSGHGNSNESSRGHERRVKKPRN